MSFLQKNHFIEGIWCFIILSIFLITFGFFVGDLQKAATMHEISVRVPLIICMKLCCLASIRNGLIIACQIGYIKVFSQSGGHTRNTTFDSLDYLLSNDVIMHFFLATRRLSSLSK